MSRSTIDLLFFKRATRPGLGYVVTIPLRAMLFAGRLVAQLMDGGL